MNRRFLTALSCLVVSVSALIPGMSRIASASHAHRLFPVTIRDDTGVTVTITHKPQRIISLDPRDTETLFSLGLEKRIVADGGKEVEYAACCKTHFKPSQWPSPWGANYPRLAPKLPHIEGGFDPAHPFDVELVEQKHPNLILSLNSDAGAIAEMRSLGLNVVVLDPHTFKQTRADLRLVGRITGHVRQAHIVLGTINRIFRSVRHRLAGIKSRPKVFYEIDDSTGTPYTACAGSFIDQMLSLAKAENVAHNVQPCPSSNPYPQMSDESLVAANPSVILLGDSNYGVSPGQVAERSGWQVINAVKHHRVYAFDDDLVSRAGPREVIGFRNVAHLLHPKAFR